MTTERGTMGTFARRAWMILSVIGLRLTCVCSSEDVLSELNTWEEKNLLHLFTNNNTNVVELMNNHSIDVMTSDWRQNYKPEQYKTNPYYGNFTEKIDLETRRLLQVLPMYDPGAGHVSAECKRHSDIFHKELQKFTLWALKMYDATAKMPSGLLNGNVNQLGDFDECLSVEGSNGIRGQYCLAYLQLNVDQSRPDLKHLHRLLHSHYFLRSNLTDPGHRVPCFETVNWAVCTPASCTTEDVKASLQHAITKYTAHTGLKITLHVDESMCQVKENLILTKATIVTSLIFIGIFVLSVTATFCQHYQIPTHELILAFSLKHNCQNLFSLERPNGDIAVLHGIRFLNCVLLLFSHKSMAVFFIPYMNRTYMSEFLGKPWTVLGRAASLYTDPFIMLSGMLTAHSFIGKLNKTGSLNLKNEYLSRLLRIVPTLAALILFCTYIMPFIGSGPQWPLVVNYHADICKKTWWRNFLFIHNYFGFENMCLTHTHHIGIDMQLFIISPLLILFLYKRPKIGTIILLTIAMISTALRFHAMYNRHLNNYVFFGTSIRQLFDTADYSYTLPSHRLTVYITGIFIGYLLRNIPKTFKLSTTTVYVGWGMSIMLFLTSFIVASRMGHIDYIYKPIDGALYNAFSPIGWCSLFIWIVITYHSGYSDNFINRLFSWRGFLVTTRISYAIYLTQFPIFFFNVGQNRTVVHYEFFSVTLNFKELIWIISTSIIFTLLFDTPFQNIKNYLINKKKIVSYQKNAMTSKME